MPGGTIAITGKIVNAVFPPMALGVLGLEIWAVFRLPTPEEATAIVGVGGIIGGAILMGLRQGFRFWLEYLRDRDQVLSGTLTKQVQDLSTQLDENKDTIGHLRRSLHEARNEANRHALGSQELRQDLQNSNTLYLALAARLDRANETIQEQNRMIAAENGENIRLRQEILLLSQEVAQLSGAISHHNLPIPPDMDAPHPAVSPQAEAPIPPA